MGDLLISQSVSCWSINQTVSWLMGWCVTVKSSVDRFISQYGGRSVGRLIGHM